MKNSKETNLTIYKLQKEVNPEMFSQFTLKKCKFATYENTRHTSNTILTGNT